MHRELRMWNPDIPESKERLDPVLRMLLQLYSSQLARIEKRIDMVWDVATNSLIRMLFPEGKRWPVPAFTVVRCELTDPVVEVDPSTRLIYREKREGGTTFFFSPHRSDRLLGADFRYILLKHEDTLIDIGERSSAGASASFRLPAPLSRQKTQTLYIGVSFEGAPLEFADVLLFMRGELEALRQIRWSYWYPGVASGGFSEAHGFCPGLMTNIADVFDTGEGVTNDWGGLRSSADLFRPLEDRFVAIPSEFAGAWQKGPVSGELGDMAFRAGIELPDNESQIYWMRLDLPKGGDRNKLATPIGIFSNCFVATNKNELTLFKHTGGNRLVEVELPEHISRVLEISEVVDSKGKEYRPAYEVRTDKSLRVYSVEEREEKLVLWFDFPSVAEPPPDSITVAYSVTSGVDANGIEAGKINELYESHPGIASCENITPTAGAIPAKTSGQILTEATVRLRSRDRALSFQELSKWAKTFDRRITAAECANSTERTSRGVRRCVALTAEVRGEEFHSDDEIDLLRTRLRDFLKSRSPVNTQFTVEIIKI